MKDKFFEKIIFLCWLLLSIIVFFSSIDEQLVVSNKLKKQINTIFPEGWGFFTKSPRDQMLDVYRINNDSLEYISMSTHSKRSLFGLSRSPRIIGYESSMMINEIPIEKWKNDISANFLNHIKDTAFIIKRKEHFKYFKEGEYLFNIYRQIPYAWSNNNQERNNPIRIVKIGIYE